MNPGWTRAGNVKGTLTAPDTPGTYFITQARTLEYSCKPPTTITDSREAAFAIINVDPDVKGYR